MTSRLFTVTCFVLFLTLSLPTAAHAQFGHSAYIAGANAPSGTINTSGSVTIKLKPNRLRMYVQATGKGKTLKDALANLKKQYEKAVPQLEAMGAKKDSIAMGMPTIAGQAKSDRINMMIRAHMRSDDTPKPEKGPKVYKINASVTAEWPVPNEKAGALLLFVDNLTEKAGKIDFSGKKDTKQLSLEEQELLEEMGGSSDPFSNSEDEVKPNEPHFLYVGTTTDEQIDKAMHEAFVKAKKHAERLAQAAQVKLGPLNGLTGGCTKASDPFDNFGGSYELQNHLQQMVRSMESKSEPKENEFVSSTPGSIDLRATVRTSFGIEK